VDASQAQSSETSASRAFLSASAALRVRVKYADGAVGRSLVAGSSRRRFVCRCVDGCC
jgi:hypothetical protein